MADPLHCTVAPSLASHHAAGLPRALAMCAASNVRSGAAVQQAAAAARTVAKVVQATPPCLCVVSVQAQPLRYNYL
jgi:hypothetical protein